MWLPRTPGGGEHAQSPRGDVEHYCAVMNIWALDQATKQEGATQQQEQSPVEVGPLQYTCMSLLRQGY